jgi:hypothetical protein
VLQYPASESPTPCWVLVLQNEQSKTNQQGELLYSGAMRHRNPRLCTMGALAQYLFWRWHISGELAPNFQRRQDWYRLKVLVGEQPTEELAYSTHYDACLSAFQKAGISPKDVTHVPRSASTQEAERLGTREGQVSQIRYTRV